MGFGFDNSRSSCIPSEKQSAGTGTGSAGIIIGCLVAPWLCSNLGRKPTLLVMAAMLTVGVVLEAFTVTSFWQLVVGRIVAYSGIGLASNVVPMYQSECAPAKIRGAFLTAYSFWNTFGSFLGTLVVYLCQNLTSEWAYLTVIPCQLMVPLGIACSYPFLPETPRFLVYQGRFEEVEAAIKDLYGPNYNDVILIACGLVANVISFYTFDGIGRHTDMFLGAFIMGAMMLGVGGTTANGHSVLSPMTQNGCVAMLVLWYFFYGLSWGPGVWILGGEIGTGQLREHTLLLSSLGSFVTSVPINFVNPYVQAAIGDRTAIIYGGFSVAATVFVYFSLPETKDRSLEELDEKFQQRIPTREFKGYVCTGLGAQIQHLEDKEDVAEKKNKEIEYVEAAI
ncbi:uncharacterized protein N7473_007099 [Penicillium subrubescens]|uniref:uncharacterized protein n=1 Tax=Penicillium subrubescens TaxID=1316194 RepID=UPI0025456B6D|nr:uncharacterized protein N7473_007099 [Penicillium subrubescens]KAJ5890871.1 hypothetical protein N7473_007099 [Penicillium subrubescens]